MYHSKIEYRDVDTFIISYFTMHASRCMCAYGSCVCREKETKERNEKKGH